jgi:hypothetical protein
MARRLCSLSDGCPQARSAAVTRTLDQPTKAPHLETEHRCRPRESGLALHAIRCRCGAHWEWKQETLIRACLKVDEQGRRELLAGVDL